MGAITRAAANNITTGGIILPAGINDASVASITALAQVSAGDGITLISSQTASASASISFTTGIDSTYRTYLFKFINIHPSAQSNLNFQCSTNGGSSYGVVCTSTAFHTYHEELDAYYVLEYKTGRDDAQATSYIALFTESTGIQNDESYSGTLQIFSPSDTTFVKHFIASNNNNSPQGLAVNSYFGGYFNTTSAINAIDFKMSSGNIDSGTIHMYGIA